MENNSENKNLNSSEESNIEFLEKAYKGLKELKKEKIELEYMLKQNELDIKHGYASSKDFRKKDGEIDIKMVKSDLLKLAIKLSQVEDDDVENPLETKLDTLIEYIQDIKDNVIDKELVDSFVQKQVSLKELKDDIKDFKGENAGLILKEENIAIDIITEIEIENFKEEKEKEFRKSNGLADKKPKKSKEDKEIEIETVIKEVANRLGVQL